MPQPAVDPYFPIEHPMHVVAPDAVVYDPAAHIVQRLPAAAGL